MIPLNNADAAFEKRYASHLKHLRLQGLQTKTVDAYARAIRTMGEHFDWQIDALTAEQLTDYFHQRIAIGMEQTKVARAPKPLGQDVLQHQPQEVRPADGASRVLAGFTVAIPERDLPIGAMNDVALPNHAAVQVAPQIDHHLVAAAHRLAVHHPAFGRCGWRLQAQRAHGRQHPGAEHRGQRLVVEQERLAVFGAQ